MKNNCKENMNKKELFNLIKLSLWGNGTAVVDRDIYEEMKQQTIAALPASCFSSFNMPPEIKKEWGNLVINQVSFYIQSNYEQSQLPISVPYVILKGTSVAKYYPYPEYRTMGDIDIMTRREDLDKACQELIDHGFQITKELNREIALRRGSIIVELHRRFASLSDLSQAKYLDDLILDNISSSHVLPDLVNGLVILEHIDQHLEEGLGLRQIIDWMMFVDKCLPDEKWPEFSELAKKIGLEKLAVFCTRMCEMYLGLSRRGWCSYANTDICENLMDYIIACGNFGNKKGSDADISEKAFAYASTFGAGFKLLQKQGLINWKTAQKYKILRPFAWIYQLFRYLSRGLKRDNAVGKIKAEYTAARRKNAMFDALGVKKTAEGEVVYKDGKYVRE